MIEYTFKKYKNGIGSYAKVSLTIENSYNFKVDFESVFYNGFFNESVVFGINRAMNQYNKTNNFYKKFFIKELIILEIDTKSSDVEIAATCAAWLALGFSLENIKIYFDNQWRLEFT